jgi:teichuronic acid biosynthesis protein TuaE
MMIKKMVYLSVLTSSIGASVISINLGFFQLSLFRIITLVSFALILILAFKTNINLKMKNGKNIYSILFMVFWFVYAILSLAWVKDYNAWLKALYFLGLGVICIIIFKQQLRSSNDILLSLKIMSVMVIIHNLIGWSEILSGRFLFLPLEKARIYAEYNYPASMFGNTNDFATYLLISVFILYICLVNSSNIVVKSIYTFTIFSSVWLMMMTSSRANVLGLIVALIFFILFSLKSNKGKVSMILALLFGFLITLIRPEIIFSFFSSFSDNLDFDYSYEGGSTYVRDNLLKNGLSFLIATGGFGTGAGNIEYWMQNYSLYPTWGITNIHNWWMEILTGYGLLVFILYIIFYLGLLLSLIKKYKNATSRIDSTISLGLICTLTGYAFGSVSSSSNIGSEWLWVYWAIVIAYQGIDNISKLEEKTYRKE